MPPLCPTTRPDVARGPNPCRRSWRALLLTCAARASLWQPCGSHADCDTAVEGWLRRRRVCPADWQSHVEPLSLLVRRKERFNQASCKRQARATSHKQLDAMTSRRGLGQSVLSRQAWVIRYCSFRFTWVTELARKHFCRVIFRFEPLEQLQKIVNSPVWLLFSSSSPSSSFPQPDSRLLPFLHLFLCTPPLALPTHSLVVFWLRFDIAMVCLSCITLSFAGVGTDSWHNTAQFLRAGWYLHCQCWLVLTYDYKYRLPTIIILFSTEATIILPSRADQTTVYKHGLGKMVMYEQTAIIAFAIQVGWWCIRRDSAEIQNAGILGVI